MIAQETGQHLLNNVMGVRLTLPPSFSKAFACNLALDIFCQGHRPAALHAVEDTPDKVVESLTAPTPPPKKKRRPPRNNKVTKA